MAMKMAPSCRTIIANSNATNITLATMTASIMKLLLTLVVGVAPLIGSSQWTRTFIGPTAPLETIHFWNELDGIIGSLGGVYITANGGATWTTYASIGLRDFDFVDGSNGYWAGIVAHSMKKTANGGLTWTNITPPTSNSLWGVSTVDASTAFWCGTGGVVWATSSSGASVQVKTNVIGDNHDIFFFDSQTGLVVTSGGQIERTTNGGNSWTNVHNSGSSLESIYFANDNIGFAVGYNHLLKSTNSGMSWTALPESGLTPFNYVHFYDANHGIVAGDSGIVLITHNGGTAWETHRMDTAENLVGCFMITPTKAIATGEVGGVYRNYSLPVSGIAPSSTITVSCNPNPADESVLFEFSPSAIRLQAISADGRVMLDESVTSGSLLVNTRMWPPGIYLYMITSSKAVTASGRVAIMR